MAFWTSWLIFFKMLQCWAPTFRISSTTSVCTSPWTGSPLTWVIRSPSRRPASFAGPPSSTCWQREGDDWFEKRNVQDLWPDQTQSPSISSLAAASISCFREEWKKPLTGTAKHKNLRSSTPPPASCPSSPDPRQPGWLSSSQSKRLNTLPKIFTTWNVN